MSRPTHSTRGGHRSALLASATAAAATPAVPDTTPLPSDQISAPAAPAVEAAPIAAPVVTETVPLPVPEAAPRDVEEPAVYKPPLVEVDSTIPLPSDQMTPLVSPLGTTDVSATTRAAIAAEEGLSAAEEAETRRDPDFERVSVGAEDRRSFFDERDPVLAVNGRGGRFTRGQGDRAIDLLRDQLESAGYGVVILSAETVDALRDVLGMHPLTMEPPTEEPGEVPEPEERRRFMVSADVHHDRKHVKPGGFVTVTLAEFNRYRAGTSIAPSTNWFDGKLVV
ncbi:hypothetical protein [Sphingomonas sp. CROZ-RG-20F-R02-07]|uniref:hypothetical protein n=1 Tax=Sphingomonas sp. CROZ-RG-20F-R02-07 TaxID=2914832 RepID=UPI001F579DBE|nr:hypothetical protein [Sphingomonas sp. CROZ-RG-20F-R02-07]